LEQVCGNEREKQQKLKLKCRQTCIQLVSKLRWKFIIGIGESFGRKFFKKYFGFHGKSVFDLHTSSKIRSVVP
jgi:hypothetical protein